MVFAVDETVFAVDETVFVVGGAFSIVDETVFAMDGAVSLRNRQPAACQPAAPVTFSLHLGKAPAPSGVALYTRAVYLLCGRERLWHSARKTCAASPSTQKSH